MTITVEQEQAYRELIRQLPYDLYKLAAIVRMTTGGDTHVVVGTQNISWGGHLIVYRSDGTLARRRQYLGNFSGTTLEKCFTEVCQQICWMHVLGRCPSPFAEKSVWEARA